MKFLISFILVGGMCFAQIKKDNYIINYNFASEAEYYFFEEQYDSSVYYYNLAFKYA